MKDYKNMVKKSKIKTIIRLMLMVVSLIGMLACAVSATVFHIQNPDMTELRRLIEFPWPTIGIVACLVVYGIGKYVIKDRLGKGEGNES